MDIKEAIKRLKKIEKKVDKEEMLIEHNRLQEEIKVLDDRINQMLPGNLYFEEI